ncbi:MAG: pyridoxal phosphate-dependent aminotransferase [Candidatus Poseidoniaceae archaeon]|jgi:hypothetical protein|nr:pyridoxal phosphate-dependent aminotransferase [Candidatus Poseidoniaceae archaeon]
MTSFHPEVGAAAKGEEIPPVSYLDWYIPKIRENRPYDLSRSGLQFEWDLSEVKEAWKDHRRFGGDERNLVASRYDVDVDNVQLCHGATQGLTLAILAASKGGRVAVEMPSYGPVSQTARILGLETIAINRVPKKGYWPIERETWARIIPDVDMVVITSHLNPTGWPLSLNDREWLSNLCRENDTIIVCDEVYADADPKWTPMHQEGEHCITINSLTKVHGLGVLRYGWIIGSEEIIIRVRRAFHNFEGMMASPSIQYAEMAFQKLDNTIDRILRYRTNNLSKLNSMLERLEIDWIPPPCGVFGAFRLPGIDTMEMIETIGTERGFLAVPGCMFGKGLEDWLRVAWSVDETSFEKSLEVLESVLRTAMNIT